jgi:GTPase involved in cell partitioning and DNA repair
MVEEVPEESYAVIRNELAEYDKEFDTKLSELPECIAMTKADAAFEDEMTNKAKQFTKVTGKHIHVISSPAKLGIDGVLDELSSFVNTRRQQEMADADEVEAEALPIEEEAI